jgi:hypothetical protein
MAKKRSDNNGAPLTGGAYLKARGLKGVVVGLTEEEYGLLAKASVLTTGRTRGLAKYIAARAVEAARRDLEAAGLTAEGRPRKPHATG